MVNRSLLLAVTAVSLGFAPAPIFRERPPAGAEAVRRQMEGVWIIESYSVGGVVQGGPGQKWEKVLITRGTWSQTCRVDGKELNTTPYVIAIDEKDSSRLDMAYAGATAPLIWGVLRLDGDRLDVTHATYGPRPTSQTSELLSSQERFVLRRARP